MTEPRFETMESAGLEELLRRPDMPPAERRAIQQELARRIAGNIAGRPVRPVPAAPPSPPVGTPVPAAGPPVPDPGPPVPDSGPPSVGGPMPDPGPPPRSVPMPSTPAFSPPREWAPPGPPPGPPPHGPYPPTQPRPKKSSGAKVGAIVGVLVVLAAAVGALVYFLNDGGDTPQQGTTCFASAGPCPLVSQAPIGSPCTCTDSFGVVYTGTVG